MAVRTLALISALLAQSAVAAEPECGPCAVGAQCVAGRCQFTCMRDADCRYENVCVEARCEPRLPLRRAGAPPTIRRGDESHPERFKDLSPIPPGFHLAREPHWELVVRGVLAFTSAYLPVAIVGLSTRAPLLTIPVAGPLVGYRADDRALETFFRVSATAVDVSVQLAGLAMVIAGFAKPARWLERDAVSFVPAAPGAAAGASLVGRF